LREAVTGLTKAAGRVKRRESRMVGARASLKAAGWVSWREHVMDAVMGLSKATVRVNGTGPAMGPKTATERENGTEHV
jgi:hypothetical protein